MLIMVVKMKVLMMKSVISHQSSVISQSVSQSDDVYDVACNVMSDVVCDDMSYVVCDVMSDVVFDGVLMLCI